MRAAARRDDGARRLDQLGFGAGGHGDVGAVLRELRGTALEYLETVLPEAVWSKLWPFLDDGERQPVHPARSSQEAMRELLASQNSIVIALEEVRRRQER